MSSCFMSYFEWKMIRSRNLLVINIILILNGSLIILQQSELLSSLFVDLHGVSR